MMGFWNWLTKKDQENFGGEYGWIDLDLVSAEEVCNGDYVLQSNDRARQVNSIHRYYGEDGFRYVQITLSGQRSLHARFDDPIKVRRFMFKKNEW